MKIFLNGAETEIRQAMLDRLLDELGYGGAHIVTAVNAEFVSRADRATLELQDGDRVEVLAPLQGG